jgi:Holliday junction resolvase-like predicted endonuclease
VFIAKNYMPRGIKGELGLVGYDDQTLTFVEVRTRTVKDAAALRDSV